MEISKASAWLMVGVMLVYFAFTSGGVFEAIDSEVIDRVDIPYSVGLSAQRTGVVGVYNADDVACARWIAYEADVKVPILGGYNGRHLVASFVTDIPRLRESIGQAPPMFSRGIPEHCYIFLTTWNVEHGEYIESVSAGLRTGIALPVSISAGLRRGFGLPEIWGTEVFRSGKAVVYEVKE